VVGDWRPFIASEGSSKAEAEMLAGQFSNEKKKCAQSDPVFR